MESWHLLFIYIFGLDGEGDVEGVSLESGNRLNVFFILTSSPP